MSWSLSYLKLSYLRFQSLAAHARREKVRCSGKAAESFTWSNNDNNNNDNNDSNNINDSSNISNSNTNDHVNNSNSNIIII